MTKRFVDTALVVGKISLLKITDQAELKKLINWYMQDSTAVLKVREELILLSNTQHDMFNFDFFLRRLILSLIG